MSKFLLIDKAIDHELFSFANGFCLGSPLWLESMKVGPISTG